MKRFNGVALTPFCGVLRKTAFRRVSALKDDVDMRVQPPTSNSSTGIQRNERLLEKNAPFGVKPVVTIK